MSEIQLGRNTTSKLKSQSSNLQKIFQSRRAESVESTRSQFQADPRRDIMTPQQQAVSRVTETGGSRRRAQSRQFNVSQLATNRLPDI